MYKKELVKEEGISQTAQDKLKRLNAYHKNIFISDGASASLSNQLKGFDVAVLDSVNELNLSLDDIHQLIDKKPKE